MEEQKVKGTILIDQVRAIRANKDLDWDKYLKPEDWEIVNQNVLPSSWYPLETYQRCGLAVFNLAAGGDTELARLRGKVRGKELFEGVYKNIADTDDPLAGINRLVRTYKNLFNFAIVSFEEAGPKNAIVTHDYDPKDPGNVPYCYTFMGHLEQLVEMTGGKNVRVELTSKQWEGSPVTTFDIKWE